MTHVLCRVSFPFPRDSTYTPKRARKSIAHSLPCDVQRVHVILGLIPQGLTMADPMQKNHDLA